MIQHFLSPGDVECEYEKECNKRSYEHCMSCKNNEIARKKKEKEKKKKNHFKFLW